MLAKQRDPKVFAGKSQTDEHGIIIEIHTGLVVEKKSINFPIVNGMLIETEDETSNNPIAMSRGFRSGLARATIFRKDDAVSGDFLKIEGS